MDLKEYVIPVAGFSLGRHSIEFSVDWVFFQQFENSPVEQGRFDITIDLDKQHDHWYVQFDVNGVMDTECDRCTAPISLPVEGAYDVIVRYQDDQTEEVVNDSEVIYVPREIHRWPIAQLIYEFVLLSIPAKKVFDCESEEPRPCDMEALKLLEEQESGEEQSSDENPFKEAFKNIELKN